MAQCQATPGWSLMLARKLLPVLSTADAGAHADSPDVRCSTSAQAEFLCILDAPEVAATRSKAWMLYSSRGAMQSTLRLQSQSARRCWRRHGECGGRGRNHSRYICLTLRTLHTPRCPAGTAWAEWEVIPRELIAVAVCPLFVSFPHCRFLVQ